MGSFVDSKNIGGCLAEIMCRSRSNVGTVCGIMCRSQNSVCIAQGIKFGEIDRFENSSRISLEIKILSLSSFFLI